MARVALPWKLKEGAPCGQLSEAECPAQRVLVKDALTGR